MTTMANGSAPTIENSAGGMEFKFLAHVQSLPVVHDSLDQIYSYPIGRNAGDAIKVVSKSAFKLSGPINPLLAKADEYADSGLKEIESRFPIVKASTSEIKDKTSGAAKTTVGTYVGAAKDKWQGATSNGHAAGEKIKAQTDGVMNQVQGSIDPILKPVIDRVEGILDTYLPKAKAAAKDAESSAKDAASKADGKGEEAKKEAEHQAQRVYDLTMSMFGRSQEGVRSSLSYAHETAISAKDTALWSLNNPTKVPEAAIKTAREKSSYVVDTVDETVQNSRKRASSLTDLAFQAKDKAFQVFDEEQKAAPKDFPRGLVVSSINTALRLSKESLDHAKNYFQSEHPEVQQTADDAANKVNNVAKNASGKADEVSSKASSKADEVSSKASSKADDVSSKAQSKADELHSDAKPKVNQARQAIRKTADSVANTVSK